MLKNQELWAKEQKLDSSFMFLSVSWYKKGMFICFRFRKWKNKKIKYIIKWNTELFLRGVLGIRTRILVRRHQWGSEPEKHGPVLTTHFPGFVCVCINSCSKYWETCPMWCWCNLRQGCVPQIVWDCGGTVECSSTLFKSAPCTVTGAQEATFKGCSELCPPTLP